MIFTIFHIAAWIALAIVAVLIFLILFEPKLAYRISASDEPLDSHEFLGLVTAVAYAASCCGMASRSTSISLQ